MRRPPIQIGTPESAREVTKAVRRLLRASGVGDRLPTPKEEILASTRLVELGELDLAEYEATLGERAQDFFHKATSKVLGLLDRRSNIIYVDPLVHNSRKRFVTYHEVTHKILPWQKITFTEDDQLTLSAKCGDFFEAEANYGAAEILFQCERFENEAKDFNVSVESALYLGGRYDSSCHAALRRLVERNHRPCLLLVLTPTSRECSGAQTSYYVVYSIASPSFGKEFDEPLNMRFVNPGHLIGEILNNSGHGEISLIDVKGFQRTCIVQTFCNSFKTFVLIHPKQIHSSRHTVHFRN